MSYTMSCRSASGAVGERQLRRQQVTEVLFLLAGHSQPWVPALPIQPAGAQRRLQQSTRPARHQQAAAAAAAGRLFQPAGHPSWRPAAAPTSHPQCSPQQADHSRVDTWCHQPAAPGPEQQCNRQRSWAAAAVRAPRAHGPNFVWQSCGEDHTCICWSHGAHAASLASELGCLRWGGQAILCIAVEAEAAAVWQVPSPHYKGMEVITCCTHVAGVTSVLPWVLGHNKCCTPHPPVPPCRQLLDKLDAAALLAASNPSGDTGAAPDTGDNSSSSHGGADSEPLSWQELAERQAAAGGRRQGAGEVLLEVDVAGYTCCAARVIIWKNVSRHS